jgi:fructan beta-fructosidase
VAAVRQPAALRPREADGDLVIADFEGENYGDWKTTGEAFGPGPARGTLPGQMNVSGFHGKGLVNSFLDGDKTTGTLTSPAFAIRRPYINFLVGGGRHPGETCINLLVGGKVVRTATGPNDRPGGSEHLDWHTFDVAEFTGQEGVIEIVDRHRGGWGHINVDQIVQSTRKLQAEPARRELILAERWLHLPVKTGSPMRRLRYVVDGSTVREFDIELADEPAFHVHSDVGRWKRQKLALEVDALPAGSKALERVVQSDSPAPAGQPFYGEKQRPGFHFTSRRGWLNDPNGLVWTDGEFHLFFQHNPYGWNWGNMHWGHAVSRDLVHWRELDIALYPPRYGDWAFSGSAVVDRGNTGGFKTGTADVIVAAFTSTGRGECIAYSNDQGRTWLEYEGNPVVRHSGRDPRLVWHAPTARWVMAVYDEYESKKAIAFHTSPDLREWTFASRIDGYFECPDLVEFELPDASGQARWVLYGADGKYVIGRFDGRSFTPETEKQQLWHGNFYAAQTWSNAPDGRKTQIGWGNGISFPESPFNQQMTVPCELSLRKTADGLRLCALPVPELAALVESERTWKNVSISPGGQSVPGLGDLAGEYLDVDMLFEPRDTASVTLAVRGVSVTCFAPKGKLVCRDLTVPCKPAGGKVSLRVLVDRGSVEVFANRGEVALSVAAPAKEEWRSVEISSFGGEALVERLTVRRLKSAWSAE